MSQPIPGVENSGQAGNIGDNGVTVSKSSFVNSFYRVLIWLGFCVVIALVPVGSNGLFSGLEHQAFSTDKAVSDLLAISIAIIGELMGYLLMDRKVSRAVKGFVGAGSLLVIIASALLLGGLSVAKPGDDLIFAVKVAIVLFVGTLILGGVCKWTEKEAEA